MENPTVQWRDQKQHTSTLVHSHEATDEPGVASRVTILLDFNSFFVRKMKVLSSSKHLQTTFGRPMAA